MHTVLYESNVRLYVNIFMVFSAITFVDFKSVLLSVFNISIGRINIDIK